MTMIRRAPLWLWALAVAEAVASVAAGASPSAILVGSKWVASDILDGQSLAPITAPEMARPTLEFNDDGGFDGFGGCNSFFGYYSGLTDSAIRFEEVRGITRAGCASDALQSQEDAFVSLLNGLEADYAILLSVNGNGMELSRAGDGIVVARFEEMEEPTILDVEWVATEVVTKFEEGEWNSGYPFGDPITVHGNVTLRLDSATSAISGFAGCNRYHGTYSNLTDGSFVVERGVSTTYRACEPEVMQQEDAYLSLLRGTIAYRFWRDGMLEMHGGEYGWTVIGRYYAGDESENVAEMGLAEIE